MLDESLFRKTALDSQTSADQLDRTLTVVSVKAWVAAVILSVIAAAVVTWSLVGEVSTYVKAQGILLNRGGHIVDAVATGSGVIVRIESIIGEAVQQGQVIARTVNPEAVEQHRSALAALGERRQALASLRAAAEAEEALANEGSQRRRQQLDELEASAREAIARAAEYLEDHRQLFREGVITRIAMAESQQSYDQSQRDLFDILRERDDMASADLRRRNDRENQVAEAQAQVLEAEGIANDLRAGLETQIITAPAAGRVIEVKTSVGAVLAPGQPVMSIETGAERLEMLVYVPPGDGKRVQPGMTALVSPSTVRREEYGALRGKVDSVSAFPVSLEGMIATLQNRSLAETISEGGQPYAGRISLIADSSTASGFAWTSSGGAAQTLTSGTLATAEVRIRKQKPITLVVPLAGEVLGL